MINNSYFDKFKNKNSKVTKLVAQHLIPSNAERKISKLPQLSLSQIKASELGFYTSGIERYVTPKPEPGVFNETSTSEIVSEALSDNYPVAVDNVDNYPLVQVDLSDNYPVAVNNVDNYPGIVYNMDPKVLEITMEIDRNIYNLPINLEEKEDLRKYLLEFRYSINKEDLAAITNFLAKSESKLSKKTFKEKFEMLKECNIFSTTMLNMKSINCIELLETLIELIPEDSEPEQEKLCLAKIKNFFKEKSKSSDIDNIQKLINLNKEYLKNINSHDFRSILKKLTTIDYNSVYGYDNEAEKSEIYNDLILDKENQYNEESPDILNIIFKTSISKENFKELYNQYLPVLKNANDTTLKQLSSLSYLHYPTYNFFKFIKKIESNNKTLSLNSLSFEQLKTFQNLLIQNNYTQFFSGAIDLSFINEKISNLFIKVENKINIDATMSYINRLLFVSHLPLSTQQTQAVNDILDNKDKLLDIDFNKYQVEKTNEFIKLKNNVKNILENALIDNTKKEIILSRLTDDITSMMFTQLPDELDNLDIINNIRTKIKEYLSFKQVEDEPNAYSIGNVIVRNISKDQKETLEHIYKAIPEIVVLLGKEQISHGFDIGTHLISVGKEVVKNDKFKYLSTNNQKLVLIAALMHDIAKIEGADDSTHPQRGSQYAYNMLNGVLSNEARETVSNLIFNHHFGENIAKNSYNEQDMLYLGYECSDKNPKFIEMLEILGEADLMGVEESYRVQDYLDIIPHNISLLSTKVKHIKKILSKLKASLELTPFPQKIYDTTNNANEEYYEEPKNGIKLRKLDLAKLKNYPADIQNQYLKSFGFQDNIDYNQLKLLIHAISEGKYVEGIEYITSQYKSDAILSTSLITMANTTIYSNYTYGFIMNPENTGIVYADSQNIGSGCHKQRSSAGFFMEILNENLDDTKYLDTLKRGNENEISEILTIDNEVAAIFVKDGAENDIPLRLVQFAHKHKLPLIVIPNTSF